MVNYALFQRQQSLGGKCGVCGDPWDGARENEAGGRYATGIIVRNFTVSDCSIIHVFCFSLFYLLLLVLSLK